MSVLIFDPLTEDASNVQLDVAQDPYTLTALSYPAPAADAQYASSVDTEGERPVAIRHRNRELRARIDCEGLTALRDLDHKIAKLGSERGTAQVMQPDGTTVTFDVVNVVQYEPAHDHAHEAGVTVVDITLECVPYGRGVSVTYTAHTESTLPALVFTEIAVPGDVPALGKLVVTEAQGVDQAWLTWGVQSRYYSSAATAALFYEAEGLTSLGSSGTGAPDGSSGGQVKRSGELNEAWAAVLSSQATGGGAHWTHIGSFRLYARVRPSTTNTGNVSLRLQWGVGDFRRVTENDPVDLSVAWNDTYRIVDLGLATIPKVTQGTQRWEARILAKSDAATSTDQVDIDWVMLVPVDEGSAVISTGLLAATPTTVTAYDSFDQPAGALDGKLMWTPGVTWGTTGDANDFTNTGSGTVTRAATGDVALDDGRFAIADVAAMTDTVVELDIESTGSGFATGGIASALFTGPVARYTDTSNFLWATASWNPSSPPNVWQASLFAYIAGARTNLASVLTTVPTSSTLRLKLYVDANGRYAVWASVAGSAESRVIIGQHDELATGGALEDGTPGFMDSLVDTGAATRTYDNFRAYDPITDAAIFASQSLEIRHDGVSREDADGAVWVDITPEGDYLLVPPAGLEDRSARFIVKASRNDPETMADPAIDDLTGQLTVTPRYLVIG